MPDGPAPFPIRPPRGTRWWLRPSNRTTGGVKESAVKTIDIDLAKTVFHLYTVDSKGRTLRRKRLPREKVLPFMANLSRTVVGTEACGSAHYWAREIQKLAHEVKLINPTFCQG